MSAYLTGDRRLDQLLPSAEKLVMAVRTGNDLYIDAMLADAELEYGDALTGARAMCVLLAALVPEHHSAEHLLKWNRNPDEYRRLRAAGVPAPEAAELSAHVTPIRPHRAAS